jgi:hypothetical protein
MSAKERLQSFVSYKGIGRNRFEKSVGISSGYLSSQSKSIGSDIIEKIVAKYNDLNIEWLITGKGRMIKDLHWQEIGTVEDVSYKKLIYAPLVGRYSQTYYFNRLNDRSYIDSLPTLPVIMESDGKGSYICFEMWDDSMNDGSDNSYNQGDILICREIDNAVRQKKLYSNKPKSFVIIHETGIIAKQIIAHDLEKKVITVHSPNQTYGTALIELQNVKKLFNILKLQRIVN